MIERCDYTSEMWEKKCEIDMAFNALFLKQDFRFYVVSKVGHCPCDLNFDTGFNDDGSIAAVCCMKHYGYESSSNDGPDPCDLGDYEIELFDDEKGEKFLTLLVDYIKANDPVLTEKLCELECEVYL